MEWWLEPLATKSHRELHYVRSSWIAEFWCTLSNIGFFVVACMYGDVVTLFAATASVLSHCVPLERVHDLDLIGVACVFLRVAYYSPLLIQHPEVMMVGSGALFINRVDAYVTRRYVRTIGATLHVVWHIASAYALYRFDQMIVDSM